LNAAAGQKVVEHEWNRRCGVPSVQISAYLRPATPHFLNRAGGYTDQEFSLVSLNISARKQSVSAAQQNEPKFQPGSVSR
jgi:hypothetical protein